MKAKHPARTPHEGIGSTIFPPYTEKLIHKNGAVYTPEKLAQYLAQKTVQYVMADPAFQATNEISVIDNAVGDGVLLKSIATVLEYEKGLENITLCGMDIDSRAIATSKQKLEPLDNKKLVLINTNSLCPFNKSSLIEGWKRVYVEASVEEGFDILIDNPPWGADLSEYRDKLDSEYFTVMQGQFDSFELFIELALQIVKAGGYFAFIIPDSILNHGKNAVRKMLLESTEIKFIARLGEKIFPRINRGCVLIICKNIRPSDDNVVDCFRLSKNDRIKILTNTLSFSTAELKSAHKVPQRRFAHNKYKQFDIDLRESETFVLEKLCKQTGILADALSISRGVELGSSGLICKCEKCNTWAPLSKKSYVKCHKCGNNYDPQKAEKTTIITENQTPNSFPLITGSDLKRYVGVPSKWIVIDKKGIKYKPKTLYDSPKILVRKTGVGLTATLDYSSAYTTQVVYILHSKMNCHQDLEFFIALINSRAYYFYIAKSFGELEWKSHPYLTQSQILSLPLPDLDSERNKKIIEKITSLLRPAFKDGKPSKDIDTELELLIGKLFSLDKNDYAVIFNAIEESDELLPILELKSLKLEELLSVID